MRSLAAIAFSFAAAILSLCLLPVGHWVFWAAGVLAAAGGLVLLLPRLRALGRLRVYLALITLSLAAGLLYGRGWSALGGAARAGKVRQQPSVFRHGV